MPADGLLLVDKPAGITSHDVVNAARRELGERRIGHGGTLDPFATGLLVLLVGRATRLLAHLRGEPKVYEATIAFGSETDTEDLHGEVIGSAPRPSLDALMGAMTSLTGQIEQVPPVYSAKRVGGRRSHELARAGVVVALAPVRIRVDAWELLHVVGERDDVRAVDVRVTCGGGTYVRSLGRDLARLAGSAAHLTALRRARSGALDVANAVPLEALSAAAVRPALAALPHLPTQSLDAADVRRVTSGIEVAATVDGSWVALTSASTGLLVALGERSGARWQPRVVLAER